MAPSSSSATPLSPSAPRTATSTASRTARCWRAWSGRGLGRDATPWLPIRSPPVNLVRWRAARDRSTRRAPVLLLANAHLLTLYRELYREAGALLEPGLGRHLCLLPDRSSIRRACSPQVQHPPSRPTASCGTFPYRLPLGFSGRRSRPTSSFFGTLPFSARPRIELSESSISHDQNQGSLRRGAG